MLFHLRSDAAEHQHVGVEAFGAGRGCDLSGPEVLRVYGQLGEREKKRVMGRIKALRSLRG